KGKIDLESAGQLAFGPDNILFVADSVGTAVYAVDLADKDSPPSAEFESIEDLDEKVAGLLGTTAGDVLINDLAAHPASKNVYLSVSRGRGADAIPVIVKADAAGRLSVVDLEGKSFTKAMIGNAPAADAKDRRGRSLRASAITDIAFHDGHLYVAGLSNEEFASNLRKIPYPFTGEMSASSIEIYHGAHGQFETHAPIRTLMPYEIDGKAHLLAAYTCTPLVTFPLDQLAGGAHVKGSTIAELGFGNAPLDMIQFTKDGTPYVLVLNSSRGGMRIDPRHFAKAAPIVTHEHITRETPTAGVPYLTVPMGGVLRADNYDDEHLVVLRRDLTAGSLQLRLWRTDWI
ncbi:MAG: hypothetical protein V3T72_00360, partial [Thermoanaerobaculia bacterium]